MNLCQYKHPGPCPDIARYRVIITHAETGQVADDRNVCLAHRDSLAYAPPSYTVTITRLEN